MASTRVLLLLLLVSLAAASHHYGGTVTFTYKGRNADGSHKVDLRSRATFERFQNAYYWRCYTGNCGYDAWLQRSEIDRSQNTQRYNRIWRETETIWTKRLTSDKPFQIIAYSCCWVPTRNSVNYWRLVTSVDLGTRSDTGKPNRSPDIAILPFLRVPQNCPRTYKLMSFDPDGDRVRCRYGNSRYSECHRCDRPSGFSLDQDSCTLSYRSAYANPRVYGFELAVEDFPRRPITLSYTDGSRSSRFPLSSALRRKRQAWWHGYTTSTPVPTQQWWWWPTTTAPMMTPSPTIPWWWWWPNTATPTTPTPTTTTTAPWWWWQTSTTTPTTPRANTTPTPSWRWWWQQTTATPLIGPAPTNSWGWWGLWQNTTRTPTTTTTPTPTTTTTTPWWWWPTTAAPTAAATPQWRWWWQQTTATPLIGPAPTNSWGWWVLWQNTTRTPRTPTTTTTPTPTTTTTTPWWWRPTTAAPTAAATPQWRWWWQQTTTTTPTTTTTTTTRPPTTTTGNTYPTSPPLSKLPLQFSFLVDPPAPSCQEGDYLPKFVSPTPRNEERIHAEVNKEMEIRVKAQARYAILHDLIMSGPTNISKHRTTHDEYVIRWTPIPEDLGEHYSICFAVEAFTGSFVTVNQRVNHQHHHHPTPSSQSGIYQSEMRCVLVDVKESLIKTNVICGESTMRVEVEKSPVSGLHEDHLQLSDPSNNVCSLQTHSNSTHIVAVFPLNACGTQLEEDDDSLIFKNELTTFENRRDLITRKHLLEVEFYCQYSKHGNVTLGFTAHRSNITLWDKGFGTLTYQFEFYQSSRYQRMMDPNSYPLEYDVGDKIYMEIDATSTVNNTQLFVESCRASPYDNPNYWPTYPIIDDGCKVDDTVKFHTPEHPNQVRFCLEAFKFIGLHDQVYISCSVMLCEAGNGNTRCARGCVNSTQSRGHHHHRRRREDIIQSANHFVSQGPLRLRRSAERAANTVNNMNLNMNLVFIAGCLLAAVGMISAVVMYKAKMSRVQYQPVPVFES